ncbi:jasmonate-induced oxygenase 1 isoform X2 [Elaeis guineensis]|uniref:jasmonate-induced oxygenase 1 isoform X2 n=1 Tax=Elaeis guineensis var. tenera TaxID=51953 RepID=UPI003C6DA417
MRVSLTWSAGKSRAVYHHRRTGLLYLLSHRIRRRRLEEVRDFVMHGLPPRLARTNRPRPVPFGQRRHHDPRQVHKAALRPSFFGPIRQPQHPGHRPRFARLHRRHRRPRGRRPGRIRCVPGLGILPGGEPWGGSTADETDEGSVAGLLPFTHGSEAGVCQFPQDLRGLRQPARDREGRHSRLGETTDDYSRELIKLCEKVMKVLSSGLGLEENFLQKAFGGDDVGVCMRVNFYPKCPQPDLALGLSSHSDPGGITVLLADDRVKGLQVRRGDAWVAVQPIPDAFIINVGDQIQVLSNATYRSVEHRVVVNSEAERISFAFFYNPKSDLPIEPAPELVTPDRPALYQPMSFNEYRLYIRKNGPRGKSQVESLKAV